MFFQNWETKVCDLYWLSKGLSSGAPPATTISSLEFPSYIYNRLYSSGVRVPIGYDDVLRFVMDRLADTAEAGVLLACSQQNVNAMRKRGTPSSVAAKEKYGLYLKHCIEHLRPR